MNGSNYNHLSQDEKNGRFLFMCVAGIGLVFIAWVGMSYLQHKQELKIKQQQLEQLSLDLERQRAESELRKKETIQKIEERTRELAVSASLFTFDADPSNDVIMCMSLRTHDSLRKSHELDEAFGQYWRSLKTCPETATNLEPDQQRE